MSPDEGLHDDAQDAVRALLVALEAARNLEPGYVQHLAAELQAFLPEPGDDRARGTASDGRLSATEEDAPPESSTPPGAV